MSDRGISARVSALKISAPSAAFGVNPQANALGISKQAGFLGISALESKQDKQESNADSPLNGKKIVTSSDPNHFSSTSPDPFKDATKPCAFRLEMVKSKHFLKKNMQSAAEGSKKGEVESKGKANSKRGFKLQNRKSTLQSLTNPSYAHNRPDHSDTAALSAAYCRATVSQPLALLRDALSTFSLTFAGRENGTFLKPSKEFKLSDGLKVESLYALMPKAEVGSAAPMSATVVSDTVMRSTVVSDSAVSARKLRFLKGREREALSRKEHIAKLNAMCTLHQPNLVQRWRERSPEELLDY